MPEFVQTEELEELARSRKKRTFTFLFAVKHCNNSAHPMKLHTWAPVYVLGYMPQKHQQESGYLQADVALQILPTSPLDLYAKHTCIYKDRINVYSQPKGGNLRRNKLNLKLHLSSRQMTCFCFALFTHCRVSTSHTMLQDYNSKY